MELYTIVDKETGEVIDKNLSWEETFLYQDGNTIGLGQALVS